ncbi:Sialic acid TRAP transporter permease protein SiaT [Pseudooceanicola marinus]|uniref:TRAP transporter large permease protein n=1 Tax=Pseudooceanicola marinus TaxID=396013 RepID=A0A1X7ABH4_9RHOB|nr:TRAP transporter large permease [Pseudooceanicola marinus]PJE33522.1 TRAP transporter large permease [Pseudooceanicola marinus]SLN73498.1 Sialic acid TRAP transporter permease protein SiaT [Pseudooceanicola marinus]
MILGVTSLAAILMLAFLRVPLGFALLGVSLSGLAWLAGPQLAGSMLAMTISENAFSYDLAVLPMFVLMGNILAATGISDDLFRAANAWLGARRGGLALATMVSCAGFASVSGSSFATAATMSKVAYPPMKSFGYSDKLASATIAAGGTLGILIPPSTILILYGILTETSIGDLFIAGIGPGVLGLLLYALVVVVISHLRPEEAPRAEPQPLDEKLRALSGVWPFALLFLTIIGGIYLKLFTPTEAAGMGAGFAILIAMLLGRLNLKILGEAFRETVMTTVMLYVVLFGAMLLAKLISMSGMGFAVQALVTESGLGPYQTLLAILGIFLVLGCVMESLAIILICVPLFAPVVQAMGMDLVWFGILVVVVTEIGLITPPVGMNVFVLNSCLPGVSMPTIFRGLLPFIAIDVLRLGLLITLPWIALALVNAS